MAHPIPQPLVARAAVTYEPDPVDVFVGAKARLRRKAMGLSQADLGERIGVSFQQVQKYERGVNRISCSALAHIASALGVEPGWFFEDMPGVLSNPAHGEWDDRHKAFVAAAEGQDWSRLGSRLTAPARAALGQVARLLMPEGA